jgi:hypothetical protein
MNEKTLPTTPGKINGIQLTLGISGLFYLLTGLALLFLPTWFFTYIGNFPPYNRHYLGDTGAFLLPLGMGLLLAARTPAAHRSVILISAVASLAHALNHAYDDWLSRSPFLHWFGETIPLLLLAGILFLIYRRVAQE